MNILSSATAKVYSINSLRMEVQKLNLDKPEFDQSTYVGRVRHFVKLTNPMNLFESVRISSSQSILLI